MFFESAGRNEEAITWFKRAEERYPLSVTVKAQLGHSYTAAGRYDEAIAHLQKTLELNQNNAWAQYGLADTYLRKFMYEKAIAESQKAVAINAKIPEFLAQLGYAYAVAGRREKALEVLDQFEKRHPGQFVNDLAALYIALGRKDAALALLQQAFEERSANLLSIRNSTVSDSLRDNPAFQKILRGIDFPQGDIQIEARK